MKSVTIALTLGALALSSGCATEQSPQSMATAAAKPDDAKLLAINLLTPKTPAKIKVTSADFQAGDAIPYTYSDYGDRISPQLSIAGVPAEAKTLVLLMEDPDAVEPKPFIHWVLFNLPASTTSLRRAVPNEMQLIEFDRTPQGLNSRGSIGYMGPRPPYKDTFAHHYHFQVFALDRRLNLPPSVDRTTLLQAMRDHVIAAGELVGTYTATKP